MGKRRISEKSSVAIVCAIVWVMFVLCFSVPFRPAEKAHATTVDDEIEIWARSKYTTSNYAGFSSAKLFIWGYIYRGTEILSTAGWEYDGYGGEVTVMPYTSSLAGDKDSTVSDDPEEGDYYICVGSGAGSNSTIDGDTWEESLPYLVASDYPHVHEFNVDGDGNWASANSNSHWAECDICGCLFQVAHRLDGKGGCRDCDVTGLASYTSTYTFSDIPDYITNNTEGIDSSKTVVEFDENGVATFDISFEAKLFLGCTLTLNLACTNGGLTAEGGVIPYTIDVSCSGGDAQPPDFSSDTGPQTIWTYTATDDDVDPDTLMASIEGTIEITLTLDWSEAAGVYVGEFSDTLTFSAELTEPEGY